MGRACLIGCGWEIQLAVNWSAKSYSKVLIASPMPRELPAPSPKKDVQQLPLAKGEGEGEEGRRHLGRYHRSRSPSGVAKLAQQSATFVFELVVHLRVRVELLELGDLVEWVVRCLEKGLGGVQHATKTGKCLSIGKGALTIFLNSTRFRVSALMGTATRALLASKYSNAPPGGRGGNRLELGVAPPLSNKMGRPGLVLEDVSDRYVIYHEKVADHDGSLGHDGVAKPARLSVAVTNRARTLVRQQGAKLSDLLFSVMFACVGGLVIHVQLRERVDGVLAIRLVARVGVVVATLVVEKLSESRENEEDEEGEEGEEGEKEEEENEEEEEEDRQKKKCLHIS